MEYKIENKIPNSIKITAAAIFDQFEKAIRVVRSSDMEIQTTRFAANNRNPPPP